jgi:hypothetical protein
VPTRGKQADRCYEGDEPCGSGMRIFSQIEHALMLRQELSMAFAESNRRIEGKSRPTLSALADPRHRGTRLKGRRVEIQ